jgi:hypothetical protein
LFFFLLVVILFLLICILKFVQEYICFPS